MSPALGLTLIAAVIGAVAIAVANDKGEPRDISLWRPLGLGLIASWKDDGRFPRWIPSLATHMRPFNHGPFLLPPSPLIWPSVLSDFQMYWLEETYALPRGGIIVWSANAASFLEKVTDLTREGPWAVMAIDNSLLPPALANLARIEKTTSTDMEWQWRVKMARVPADLVDRPHRENIGE